MDLSYPFELPDVTREALEKRFDRKRRDNYLWEEEHNDSQVPFFWIALDSWHCMATIIFDAIQQANGQITRTDNDKAGCSLYIGVQKMEDHLKDLEETLAFLSCTWPYDPAIKAHFNGKKEAETTEGEPR